MQTPGSNFLHERNPNLHISVEVNHVADYLRAGGEAIPNNPADKISAHLGFLASHDYVNDGILTGDEASIERQIGVHVIKAEDVPESYFELQRRIAREEGHGDIHINDEMRRQMTEAVQADQKAGLSKWVEYLGGNDGGYPDWFKTYTWSAVTKLGSYDKGKHKFQKRSKGTTAAYPELNREALAYVYDALDKSRVQGVAVDGGENDARLQKLLEAGNFGKLYAHAVMNIAPDNPELRNEIRGSWTKFNQTDDPRTARRLSGSLQGHGTGWCTAGESTAIRQLHDGDFYVYYTRNEDGKDSVPRVAIRMEEGEVAEVRGVNPSQELELVMADVTAEQLKDLPGGDEYIRKAEDMKRLTAIDKKTAADPNVALTSDELRFLYELDHEIQGFGYDTDPRIAEIRKARGDRDKPELAHILPESIRAQVQTAYSAYSIVADKLQGMKRGLFGKREVVTATPETMGQLFAAKDKEWQENGVYDYLAERFIESGTRFNLVATPNIEASEAQVVGLAEDFGKDQPYETYVDARLFRHDLYDGKEWSGTAGAEPLRLSLMPSMMDGEISYRSVPEQVRMLAERQAKHPNLNVRVPSLFDAVTYWYSLRAGGEKLVDDSAADKTFIRHFDLAAPETVVGWSADPYSSINYEGRPSLGDLGDLDGWSYARLSVG